MGDRRLHKSETFLKLNNQLKSRKVEDSTRSTLAEALQGQAPAHSTNRKSATLGHPFLGSRTRRNIDTTMLSTGKLPEIEPVVSPSTYLTWRFTHTRGQSSAAFDKCNQILKSRAINAIESFEQKLKKQNDRDKKVKKFMINENKEYLTKVNTARMKWNGVQNRQKEDFERRITRGNQVYNKNISEIKERYLHKTKMDSIKSRDHQTSIQTTREKRTKDQQNLLVKEQKRVADALSDFQTTKQLGFARANSARSERVNQLKKQNLDWESACESQISRMNDKKLTDLNKDIMRQQHQEAVLKKKTSVLKETSKQAKAMNLAGRRSFSSQSAYITQKDNEFVSKVNDKMTKIDQCNLSHKKKLEDVKSEMKEVNQQRVQDNLQGKAVEKVMLNSIKERVWKKHKQTQIRRRKIIKDVAPPSTYEIYTTNYTSRSIRNSFQLATPVAKPVDADPSNPGKTQYIYTPLNLRNPLVDMSLKLAMSHTAKNPFRINQKAVKSMIPE